MNNIDDIELVVLPKFIGNLSQNDDILCEIMTRNLIFNISDFEYLYEIRKSNFLYDLGIFSILINYELLNGIYEVIKFTLLVDLKFLNLQENTLNIIVIDNVNNLTGVFKVNNYTYFNLNMNGNLLENIKIDSIYKLNNYIDNAIKVKDFICFWINYIDSNIGLEINSDIYKYYSNISNIAHVHTKIRFDIIIDLDVDLLNIILVLKRIYERLLSLRKTIYYCELHFVLCNDIMFNFNNGALQIYLKKLLNYFDTINIEYFIDSQKKNYIFNKKILTLNMIYDNILL